jgi:hypothetical protein
MVRWRDVQFVEYDRIGRLNIEEAVYGRLEVGNITNPLLEGHVFCVPYEILILRF